MPHWWWHPNRTPDGKITSYSCRVGWYQDGKRKRENVRTQNDAEEMVAKLTKQLLEAEHGLGTQITTLTKAQIKAAELAFSALERNDYFDPKQPASAENLVKAVEWFVETFDSNAQDIPPIAAAIEKFIATRVDYSPRTIASHRTYLNEFAQDHGKLLVAAITPQIIDTYLKAVKAGPVAKLHRWSSLHALFEFCHGKKNTEGAWIGINPVKRVPQPVYHPNKPKVYSLAEVRKLIEGAIIFDYSPNVLVRLFSMIRSDEMAAMVANQGSIWPYIDLPNGLIRLSKNEVKTKSDKKRGGREISILPILHGQHPRWSFHFGPIGAVKASAFPARKPPRCRAFFVVGILVRPIFRWAVSVPPWAHLTLPPFRVPSTAAG